MIIATETKKVIKDISKNQTFYLPKLATIKRGSKRTLILRSAILDLMSLIPTDNKGVTKEEVRLRIMISDIYRTFDLINEKIDKVV